ncbi:MAG: ribosome biogenesis GTP-binding protein YihA/YsxC [Flavobacteriales bacterium]|nr:ribosome biogenesis GTP-binding protein YihA/YsxC [Flavobacteriales bacterium]
MSDCPNSSLPEFAFIGRSNVGKSSLINMICNRNKLANTSNKPGKTRLLNYFVINEAWHLVDMPGYGYAKVSKKDRKDWLKFSQTYFKKRKNLVLAFVLIDSRHKLQQVDLDFMIWLNENFVPFTIIFTKTDKLGKAALQKTLTNFNSQLSEYWEILPHSIISSSVDKRGRDEILDFISKSAIQFKTLHK